MCVVARVDQAPFSYNPSLPNPPFSLLFYPRLHTAMELSRNSPDSERSDPSLDDDDVLLHSDGTVAIGGANGMATMVAHPQPAGNGALGQQAQKRYRPAPAKTFQCRGYGECRMVFSRSEHLARHIRYVYSPLS